MRARYYNPRIMRFVNADPIGFTGGSNWYAFAGNNPITGVDPSGYCGESVNSGSSSSYSIGNTFNPVGQLFDQAWSGQRPALGPDQLASMGHVGLALELFGASVTGAQLQPMRDHPYQTAVTVGLMFAVGGESPGVTSEGAADAFQYQLLKQDLLSREASSVFTESGSLSREAINGSRQIIAPSDLINPQIPDGFGKFSTETFNSPSGPAQVHFYMKSETGEIFQDFDYKTVFNTTFGTR